MDQTIGQILEIWDHHKDFHHNLQIYQLDDQHPLKIWEGTPQTLTPEDNTQDHKVGTNGKIIQIIEMILFLTETTGMTRIELDVKRPDSMRDTASSILQIIIIIHNNHLLQFLLQDPISVLH